MRAVAYYRYSTDRQNETSIDAQRRAVHLYAQREGIIVDREYIDEGKSATTDDRPDFQQMIRELPQTKPDFVLVHKVDRFARDRYDAAQYKRQISNAGARMIAVDQPLDPHARPEDIILESLLDGMAEYYSKNLAKEVMKGMKEKALKAKYNGGWIPLGYDIDDEDNYVINEYEAETVRIIFKMRADGQSYTAIINELNGQGRRTRRGMEFGKNSIHEILKNPKYVGDYVFNESPKKINGKRNHRIKKDAAEIIVVPGAIPAIIDRETWDIVQAGFAKTTKPRRRTEEIYMLTGLLKCGTCGGPMVGTVQSKTYKGERQSYHYYQCASAKRNRSLCVNSKVYSKHKIENSVIDALEALSTEPKNIEDMAKHVFKEIKEIHKSRAGNEKEIRKQIAEIDKEIDSMKKAIKQGFDVRMFKDDFNVAALRKEQLERQLESRRSPFAGVTYDMVLAMLKQSYSMTIDRTNPEELQRIMASYVKEAIVENADSVKVLFSYRLPGCADKAGVGGPLPAYPYTCPIKTDFRS